MMIIAENIHKSYREGKETISVLQGLDFKIAPQKKIGILGASGAGKSTLLHILGGLDTPSSGKVLVEGDDLYHLADGVRSRLRNRFFGFIFQFYHLLPELTALENVMLPALIAGCSKIDSRKWASDGLIRVGLAKREAHLPSELSGGEQQRVALARACILKPKVVLADEPTGNLDQKSGGEVLHYLLEVVAHSGGSLVMVTHNQALVENMDEVFELKDGKLEKK